MIFRLCTPRLIVPNGWQKVLNTRAHQITKINHHTLISSSFCFKNQQKKFNEIKLFHQKQPSAQKDERSLVNVVVSSIKNNPYVRISRFDRPIGEALKLL